MSHCTRILAGTYPGLVSRHEEMRKDWKKMVRTFTQGIRPPAGPGSGRKAKKTCNCVHTPIISGEIRWGGWCGLDRSE